MYSEKDRTIPRSILSPWKKNDRKATILIITFSVIVFALVSALGKITWHVDLGFNVHVFAMANAIINSMVAGLLICGLAAVKKRRFLLHKQIMLTAMFLSILFLVSYICHHLFAGEAKFGDVDHDGLLSESEKVTAGTSRYLYYFILATHIPLAGLILPFILFTTYRALIGEYEKHKRLVRITWPIWFYVAVTGVIVYLMISPYYS
jgi:putative membrane protein